MATLDSLAGDQRAVLQLVLGRGRGYGEIASLLSIDAAAVRERALAALDALGPDAGPPDPDRGLVADYLLGQLSEPDLDAARALLARSSAERAWARAVSAELAPVASGPLPEIPEPSAPPPPAPSPPAGASEPAVAAGSEPAAAPTPQPAATPTPQPTAAPAPATATSGPPPATPPPPGAPRSSRRGGMILIGAVVVIIAAIVVVLVLRHGSSPNSPSARVAATTSTTQSTNPGRTTQTPTTSADGTGSARIITQINLTPTTAGSRAAAIADVLQQGSQREIAIVGQGLPPNTKHNSYAVWLYNSPHDAVRLGFVSPGVTTNGKLSAASPLPSSAGRYRKLIVTTETSSKPSAPGPILLQGPITDLR